MVTRIAHIGIATHSVEDAARFYRLLGLEVDSVEVHPDQSVKAAMLKVGDSALELLEATDDGSAVARFIDKRGEGIHHITFEVDDLESELSKLRAQKIRLINEKPVEGVEGSLVAFVHPGSAGGVLVELSQSRKGGA